MKLRDSNFKDGEVLSLTIISWINVAFVSLRQAYHLSLYFPMSYVLLVDTLIVWDFISMNLGIGNPLSSERLYSELLIFL